MARLILGLSAALFVVCSIYPQLHMAAERTARLITGASVHVGEVRADWRRARLQLLDFKAAHPHQADKAFIVADRVDLELDPERLWKREIHVRRGRMVGLRLDADGAAAGQLTGEPAQDSRRSAASHFERRLQPWLRAAVDSLRKGADAADADVQASEELLRGWVDRFAVLESQSQLLRQQASDLQKTLVQAGENPLRNFQSYQQAIERVEQLGREAFQVRGAADRARQQWMMDRDEADRLRKVELASREVPPPTPRMDCQAWTDYLLAADVAERIQQVLSGLRWSCRYVPALTARYGGGQRRGQNIWFAGLTPRPRLLVDTMVLQGQGLFDDEQVRLEGVVRNLSSEPNWLEAPTEVVIQTTEGPPLLLHAELDATEATPEWRVLIDCPRLPVPRRWMGVPDQLAVAVEPGSTHLWLEVRMLGDSLSGEMLLRQRNVKLTPQLNPRFDAAEMAEFLTAACDGVDRLDTRVTLAGTLMSPEWTIRSNIGPALSEQLAALTDEMRRANHRQRLERRHAQSEKWQAQTHRQLLAVHATILDNLQLGSQEIERVRSDIASRAGRSIGVDRSNRTTPESLQR